LTELTILDTTDIFHKYTVDVKQDVCYLIL
jgi:hypothetical protein